MRIAATTEAITPSQPAAMGGYDGPDRLANHNAGALEINIIQFGHGPDGFAIVAVDTLFAGPNLTDAVTDHFATQHGLPPERVLTLASHTHFAPMLDTGKPRIGRVSAGALEDTMMRLSRGIEKLCSREAATVDAGAGASDAAVNRRRYWPWPTLLRALKRTDSAWYMADNPHGPRDRRIRTAIYRDAGGAPIAAIWAYACHPVGFPVAETASPDFPGVVRCALRARYGAGLPVIFAPGCMGDIRPRSPAHRANPRSAMELLAYGPRCRAFTPDEWQGWADGIAADVVAATRSATTHQLARDPAIPAAMAVRQLDDIIAGKTAVDRFTAKAAVIPGLGRIVALSCEPVTQIAPIFARGPDDLILGYEGDVFGYLPTEEIIAQGGYEATRFMPFFEIDGDWRDGLSGRLADMAAELAC